jgi:protein TonB
MSHKRYEKKAFILSIFLHSALFGSYFLYTKPEVVETKSSSTAIVMQLSSFELPKKSLEKPTENKPKERPKKRVKKEHKLEEKRVKKQKVKPKPVEKQIVKKEAILPKKKPIKKEIETAQKVAKKQEIIKPENTEVASAQEIQKKESIQEKLRLEKEQQAKMAQQQQFVQTNFDIIRNKVFSHLIYPNTAKRMGWTGVIELALVINPNGKLIDISIHKSSNKKMLDEAAIKAAKKIQKEQLPKPQITSTIILPIAFKLS